MHDALIAVPVVLILGAYVAWLIYETTKGSRVRREPTFAEAAEAYTRACQDLQAAYARALMPAVLKASKAMQQFGEALARSSADGS